MQEILRTVRARAYRINSLGTDVKTLELNLSLDEIAEVVACDWNLFQVDPSGTDGMTNGVSGWFSLDPDIIDEDASSISSDVLVRRKNEGWWKDVVGAQEAGQWTHQDGFINFPSGIYVAVNPIICCKTVSATLEGFFDFMLYYRLIKPTANQLAMVVARRR